MLRDLGARVKGMGPHSPPAFTRCPQDSLCFSALLTSLWSAQNPQPSLCKRDLGTSQWLKRENSGRPLRERKFSSVKLGRQPLPVGCDVESGVASAWSATPSWHLSPSPRIWEQYLLSLSRTVCHPPCLTPQAHSPSTVPVLPPNSHADLHLPNSIPALLEGSS